MGSGEGRVGEERTGGVERMGEAQAEGEGKRMGERGKEEDGGGKGEKAGKRQSSAHVNPQTYQRHQSNCHSTCELHKCH